MGGLSRVERISGVARKHAVQISKFARAPKLVQCWIVGDWSRAGVGSPTRRVGARGRVASACAASALDGVSRGGRSSGRRAAVLQVESCSAGVESRSVVVAAGCTTGVGVVVCVRGESRDAGREWALGAAVVVVCNDGCVLPACAVKCCSYRLVMLRASVWRAGREDLRGGAAVAR